MSDVDVAGAVLSAATDLITGDRRADYGPPSESFGRIAAMWSAYLDCEVTATQVAHMMALLKLARLANHPEHRDSAVDAAAYAALGYGVLGHE